MALGTWSLMHTGRVKLQLHGREQGHATWFHLQPDSVLPPGAHHLSLSTWLVEEHHSAAHGKGSGQFLRVRNLASGKTLDTQDFRVTLTWCYLALLLKEELLPPAAYPHPMQQHNCCCGHRENPARRWTQVKISLGGGKDKKAKQTTTATKQKHLFLSSLFWFSCAAVWVLALSLCRGRSHVEKKIDGRRSKWNNFFWWWCRSASA